MIVYRSYLRPRSSQPKSSTIVISAGFLTLWFFPFWTSGPLISGITKTVHLTSYCSIGAFCWALQGMFMIYDLSRVLKLTFYFYILTTCSIVSKVWWYAPLVRKWINLSKVRFINSILHLHLFKFCFYRYSFISFLYDNIYFNLLISFFIFQQAILAVVLAPDPYVAVEIYIR